MSLCLFFYITQVCILTFGSFSWRLPLLRVLVSCPMTLGPGIEPAIFSNCYTAPIICTTEPPQHQHFYNFNIKHKVQFLQVLCSNSLLVVCLISILLYYLARYINV